MHGSRIARTVVGIVTLLLLAGCAPGVAPTPSPSGGDSRPAGEVRIVLGLYSGRPDPEWTLTDAQVAALDAILAGLPDATGVPPTGGLGYHGFTVIRAGQTLVAYLGVVAQSGAGPGITRADPGRRVERLLLETGRARLAGAEIAEVEQSLAGVP